MEKEAYKVGNLCFRDWEDGVKMNKIQISMPLKESLLREEEPEEELEQIQEKTYAVQGGDTLSAIAGALYSDIHKWPLIYKANEGIIGEFPDIIKIGMQLKIPPVNQWDSMDQKDKDYAYSKSKFYKKFDGVYNPVSAGIALRKPESIEDVEVEDIDGLTSEDFKSFGEPYQNALAEWKIWKRGKIKETNPEIANRLAAMWRWCGWNDVTPENANRHSVVTHWSGVALSWCFRGTSFPRGASHVDYMQAARINKEHNTPGYQLFTSEELDHEYELNDVLCYIPSSYGKYHCDIYVGNNKRCGGNLSNTFARGAIRKRKGKAGYVYKDEIKYIIRKVGGSQSLEEWKNKELNRLLLEKFNLGDKK